ncbi:hypothetical protein CAPTEDRAFT_180028 [Capitella teleta]|uniref:RRM domain-containing protein n=1 Tax=Capitella teleta TaxID=283909 RepID=R7U241_CAPTE|nr:hypothetical protein CAPTEDRAFT_180028 [Capitella teleta]|eukprot:ELT97731.1 hypothetical protein CAPTEDRAFT_180028 [Capitella teleta]
MSDSADRTIWCGNLPDDITEELLYELFLQAGPLCKVNIPKESSGRLKRFGFIEFRHSESVPYAIELMNGIKLFDCSLQLKPRSGSSHDRPVINPVHRSVSAPNVPLSHGQFSQGHDDRRQEGRSSVYDRLGGRNERSMSREEVQIPNRGLSRWDARPGPTYGHGSGMVNQRDQVIYQAAMMQHHQQQYQGWGQQQQQQSQRYRHR